MKKRAYCIFDSLFDGEKSVGALRIYLPTKIGYINFNIGHSVDKEIVCDMWRMTFAYACDDDFKNAYPLNPSAEWDMAVRIKDRDDFIGGQLHGDEIYTGMKLFVDGAEKDLCSLTELTAFDALIMQVESIGYDPKDHRTEALKHYKEYTVTADGISTEQRVEWLNDYELSSCYLAMMPPLKTYTDSYYTDADTTVRKITNSNFRLENRRSATLFGEESKLHFRMSVPKYPKYDTGNCFLLSDNGGRPYNKMYFPVCTSACVKNGEVWESRTEYIIRRGESVFEELDM